MRAPAVCALLGSYESIAARTDRPGRAWHAESMNTQRPDAPLFASVKAVIFDWDGTLVDSQPLNFAALCQALKPYGVTVQRDWYWRRLGTSVLDLLAELDIEVPVDAVVSECRRLIIDGIGSLRLHEEVLGIAKAAKAAALPLAVASGGAGDVVRAGINATGLSPWFATVVTREDVMRGKPAPDLFLEAARRLGADPAGCLVLEDADEGLEAAARAGMRAIDVRSGLIAHQ